MFNFKNLAGLYDKKIKKYGVNEAPKHISELLAEAKSLHEKEFIGDDHEQSWRAFKGKNLEKLILYILKKEIQELGLKIIEGNKLERTLNENLSEELDRLKRNILVDFGQFGSHLPDVDLIVYEPKTIKVICLISSKVTLRERIAQTGYWKLKLASSPVTKNVRVFFITPDEDGTLENKAPCKKGRAIVEVDTDGGYVMSETKVEESDKVKMFDKFIIDLRRILNENRKSSRTSS